MPLRDFFNIQWELPTTQYDSMDQLYDYKITQKPTKQATLIGTIYFPRVCSCSTEEQSSSKVKNKR